MACKTIYEIDDPVPSKVTRVGGAVKTFDRPRTVYKKVQVEPRELCEKTVARLVVPEETRVVYPESKGHSWNNQHLRVERAYVGSIRADTQTAYSICSDHLFEYREGREVKPHDFSTDTSIVSAPGIHCFATESGARHW